MGSIELNSIELEILESKFDVFLNKTIVGAAKNYYNKEILHSQREITVLDDDNVEDGSRKYIEDELCFFDVYDGFGPFDENYELNIAYESLSDIEQMVIFLYFKKKYKMNEIAKILNLRDETVTRIKKRALTKIKLFLEGEFDYE